jgi:GTPase involved in cell partitioning and DNA repair
MGIKTDNQGSGPAFSRDVLRVEITGPDEEHLTVIDVPGIAINFQSFDGLKLTFLRHI